MRAIVAMTTVLIISSLGCGSRIPSEFQVSGKPIEHWLAALHDADANVRIKAVRALGNVGPHHPQAIPALTEALSDPDASVRAQASLALLKSGPKARSAVPALQTAAGDADPTVRQYATEALKKISA